MSQFDSHKKVQYIDTLRSFLGISKAEFQQKFSLYSEDASNVQPRRDRNVALISLLEENANKKAARVEAPDTDFAERYNLAKSYMRLFDSDVARAMQVSREWARSWGTGKAHPTDMEKLSIVVQAPLAWLRDGNVDVLPANSTLGLRVGAENLEWRRALFDMTQAVLAELDATLDDDFLQAHLEWAVFYKPQMAHAARRAGGRWQVSDGQLVFAPWVPLQPKKPKQADLPWSDEIEAIIQEELENNKRPTIAGQRIKERCLALGYSEEECPKQVTVFKRAAKKKAHIERFGADLNAVVAAAVQKYAQQA